MATRVLAPAIAILCLSGLRLPSLLRLATLPTPTNLGTHRRIKMDRRGWYSYKGRETRTGIVIGPLLIKDVGISGDFGRFGGKRVLCRRHGLRRPRPGRLRSRVETTIGKGKRSLCVRRPRSSTRNVGPWAPGSCRKSAHCSMRSE